ncbi:MAG: hypothetical protein M1818_004741 [Claussenomyces sp. TS43310]|nr:MAG: hypothetical protein M1818_004741 [Claussenomyces sp. TS43310]
MATEFAMPAPATTYSPYNSSSPQQYSLYGGAPVQQISPANSANGTPRNASPTSPRSSIAHLPVHTRQLRPPKSPLYVPAVLRPTEPPRRISKPSPLTPPQSMNGSFDSLNGARPLSRRSTTESGKFGFGNVTESEWSDEGFAKVTDLPTRKHWKPDAEATVCDEATCTRTFTYFTRRHHCRRCGNIFCDYHSSHLVPLDQDANFHPGGTRARACGYCFAQYKGWEIARSSRSNSECSTEAPQTPTTANTPSVSCKGKQGAIAGGMFGKGSLAQSLGASVPRDWNWSTF